jgi:hypothetical protein
MFNTEVSRFTFSARGHPNITANHGTTLEVTKDSALTLQGDCIIGVSASHSVVDIPEEIKFRMRQADAKIILEFRIGGLFKVVVEGVGHPGLAFDDSEVMIVRKSDFVDGRTLMIRANIAANELSRDLVEQLQDPNTKINFTLHVSE